MVSAPKALKTMRVTLNNPGFSYTTTGMESLEKEGLPPGKNQSSESVLAEDSF